MGVRGAGRSVLFGLRAGTARIRAPWFWRALYCAAGSRLGVGVTAAVARWAARAAGTTPIALLDRALPLFETGWPHHLDTPWVNLHAQRIHRRVVRRLEGAKARPQRPPRAHGSVLRVGILARLEDAFFFTRPFFAAAPEHVEVVAFDLGSDSDAARPWAEPEVEAYHRFSLTEPDALAAAIEAADLDVLVGDVRKPQIYGILDRLETPCVALMCAEVHLRHHPSVAFHLYPFLQADYVPRENRLFCGTTRRFFGPELVLPASFAYDLRGLDPLARRPWAEREPLIVAHGRLFKASQPYLEVLCGLLAEDDELELVFMGQDSHGALGRILATADRVGVGGRVHYEGPYTTVHDEEGRLADPAWWRLLDLLSRARLAPDPWPLAGGSSRIEAYASGVPSVHMGIRTDAGSWGRPQDMVTAEHAALLVPRGTAYSVAEYAGLARRAVHDEAWAEALVAEQAELAVQLGDQRLFWHQLTAAYEQWHTGRVLSRARISLPRVSIGRARARSPVVAAIAVPEVLIEDAAASPALAASAVPAAAALLGEAERHAAVE